MFSNEKEKGFAAVEQNELESVNGGLSRGNMGGSFEIGDFGGVNLGGVVTLPGFGGNLAESLPWQGGIEIIQRGFTRGEMEEWFSLGGCGPYLECMYGPSRLT